MHSDNKNSISFCWSKLTVLLSLDGQRYYIIQILFIHSILLWSSTWYSSMCVFHQCRALNNKTRPTKWMKIFLYDICSNSIHWNGFFFFCCSYISEIDFMLYLYRNGFTAILVKQLKNLIKNFGFFFSPNNIDFNLNLKKIRTKIHLSLSLLRK